MARRIRTQPRRGLRMRRLVRSFAVLIAVLALGGCDALIARFILPARRHRGMSARMIATVSLDRDALIASPTAFSVGPIRSRPIRSPPRGSDGRGGAACWTGPLSAVLYVATDAASTDFTVKLVDVHPDNSCSDVGVDDVVDLYSP